MVEWDTASRFPGHVAFTSPSPYPHDTVYRSNRMMNDAGDYGLQMCWCQYFKECIYVRSNRMIIRAVAEHLFSQVSTIYRVSDIKQATPY